MIKEANVTYRGKILVPKHEAPGKMLAAGVTTITTPKTIAAYSLRNSPDSHPPNCLTVSPQSKSPSPL